MNDEWQVEEGTGWITIPSFGKINPRRDNVADGRQYFTARLENDEYAKVMGETITGGPETWHFEFDQPFHLADRSGEPCLEVVISLLEGGRYAVKHRPSIWPSNDKGPW